VSSFTFDIAWNFGIADNLSNVHQALLAITILQGKMLAERHAFDTIVR
jgi:hypothetical protein